MAQDKNPSANPWALHEICAEDFRHTGRDGSVLGCIK